MSKPKECYCIHDIKKRKHRPDILCSTKAEVDVRKSKDDIVITFIEKSAYDKAVETLKKILSCSYYADEAQNIEPMAYQALKELGELNK